MTRVDLSDLLDECNGLIEENERQIQSIFRNEEVKIVVEVPVGKPLTEYAPRITICDTDRFNPDFDNAEPQCHPKTNRDKNNMQKSLSEVYIFDKVRQTDMDKIVSAMVRVDTSPGEIIFQEGDEDARDFFMVANGTFEVTSRGVLEETLKDEGYFGEMALLCSGNRESTVTSLTKGVLWKIDRLNFRRAHLGPMCRRSNLFMQILSKIPFLRSLSNDQRLLITNMMKERIYQNNEYIMIRGFPGNGLYVVESGSVVVKRKGASMTEKRVYGVGDYFGQSTLISNKPLNDSVKAQGRVVLSELSTNDFKRRFRLSLETIARDYRKFNYQTDLI
ncbi:hypothetical protein ACOME3_000232 [Neoechinorhynchus agilis]